MQKKWIVIIIHFIVSFALLFVAYELKKNGSTFFSPRIYAGSEIIFLILNAPGFAILSLVHQFIHAENIFFNSDIPTFIIVPISEFCIFMAFWIYQKVGKKK